MMIEHNKIRVSLLSTFFSYFSKMKSDKIKFVKIMIN